jgi:hypothetical protein
MVLRRRHESRKKGLPGMEAAHRDTGRTRNTACGWYVISSAVSTDT